MIIIYNNDNYDDNDHDWAERRNKKRNFCLSAQRLTLMTAFSVYIFASKFEQAGARMNSANK